MSQGDGPALVPLCPQSLARSSLGKGGLGTDVVEGPKGQ